MVSINRKFGSVTPHLVSHVWHIQWFTLSPDNFTRLSSSTRCTIFTRLPISQCPLFLPFSLGLRGLLVSHGGAHLLSNVREGPRPHSGRFVAWFSSLPPFVACFPPLGFPPWPLPPVFHTTNLLGKLLKISPCAWSSYLARLSCFFLFLYARIHVCTYTCIHVYTYERIHDV